MAIVCVFFHVDNSLNLIFFLSPAQCLNAVRTVQSLACLDEADHTVGFLLQLSSFCKEWQFHLPKLLQDVQASPEESCTSAEIMPQLHWCSHLFTISPRLFCVGKPVLSVPDLHVSAAQQEDASSLPPGQNFSYDFIMTRKTYLFYTI